MLIDAFLKTHQIQIELVYKSYQVAIKKVIREIPRTERTDRRSKMKLLIVEKGVKCGTKLIVTQHFIPFFLL